MPSHGQPPLSRLQLVTVTFAGYPFQDFVESFCDFLTDQDRWGGRRENTLSVRSIGGSIGGEQRAPQELERHTELNVARADALRPVGFGVADEGANGAAEAAPAIRETHAHGARIVGIGGTRDVSRLLEVIDERAHRLLSVTSLR
jgi:hypothetical protein